MIVIVLSIAPTHFRFISLPLIPLGHTPEYCSNRGKQVDTTAGTVGSTVFLAGFPNGVY